MLGTQHSKHGKCCEILWIGQFSDLQKAMYWGAKKELEAIRKKGFNMASRVIWQHELTPEQAVATVYKQMEPQMERVMKAWKRERIPTPPCAPGPRGR